MTMVAHSRSITIVSRFVAFTSSRYAMKNWLSASSLVSSLTEMGASTGRFALLGNVTSNTVVLKSAVSKRGKEVLKYYMLQLTSSAGWHIFIVRSWVGINDPPVKSLLNCKWSDPESNWGGQCKLLVFWNFNICNSFILSRPKVCLWQLKCNACIIQKDTEALQSLLKNCNFLRLTITIYDCCI